MYKNNIEVLKYKNYIIDAIHQKIYRFRFHRSNFTENQLDKIKEKYNTGNYSQRELSKLYNTTQSTIQRILICNKKDYWVEMIPGIGTNGYYFINFYNNGSRKTVCLHQLFCEIYHGPRPPGMIVRHLDRNKLNNTPENIIWGTPKENENDKIIHGTFLRGEQKPSSKLNNNDIVNIRYLNQFLSYPEIASIYKVNKQTICSICLKQTWKHI